MSKNKHNHGIDYEEKCHLLVTALEEKNDLIGTLRNKINRKPKSSSDELYWYWRREYEEAKSQYYETEAKLIKSQDVVFFLSCYAIVSAIVLVCLSGYTITRNPPKITDSPYFVGPVLP